MPDYFLSKAKLRAAASPCNSKNSYARFSQLGFRARCIRVWEIGCGPGKIVFRAGMGLGSFRSRWMNRVPTTFRALLVVGVTATCTLLLGCVMADPPLEFCPLEMRSISPAWVGSTSYGLFALLLGTSVLDFLYQRAADLQAASLPVQVARLGMLVAIGGLVSWGIGSLNSARRRGAGRQPDQEVLARPDDEVAAKAHQDQLAEEMHRRQLAEMALREREERVRMAVESTGIGTWDFNPLTGERNWSDRAKVMFGLSPDIDVSDVLYLERIHPEDRERAGRAVQRALDPSGNGAYEIDCRLVWPDGSIHWFIVRGQAFFEGRGPERRACRFIGTVFDITQRKHAEEALRASEVRLQAIVNNTSSLIYLKDSQGRYQMVNRRFEELFNTSQGQIIGKTDADVFPAEIAAKLQTNDRQVRDSGQTLEFEETVPREDGDRTYISVKFPVRDGAGNVSAVGGISTDITDRKRALEALEAEQELLRHTIEDQDHERQLVTYEILDGLVQYVAGALLQLESIRDQLNTSSVAEEIDKVVGTLQKAVVEGRRLINGIRTPVLDDWGVVAAIEQLIEEEDRAHVQMEFVQSSDVGRLAPNLEEAIYRITQEALTDIHKHSNSNSNKVRIELGRQENQVHLEIQDWGVGFTPSKNASGIHGLRGMMERARIVSGRCTLESAPGQGTRIVVDLPYTAR